MIADAPDSIGAIIALRGWHQLNTFLSLAIRLNGGNRQI
jgi:hypothetical protein